MRWTLFNLSFLAFLASSIYWVKAMTSHAQIHVFNRPLVGKEFKAREICCCRGAISLKASIRSFICCALFQMFFLAERKTWNAIFTTIRYVSGIHVVLFHREPLFHTYLVREIISPLYYSNSWFLLKCNHEEDYIMIK